MQVSEIFLALGEEPFGQLLRSVSMGKLKTYQLYERMKARSHLPKLNIELLRKAAPRFWARLGDKDEEFAADLAQSVLVSNLEMVRAVLEFLGVPNEDGFFAKDLDASAYLTEGWQQRAYDKFHSEYSEPLLVFYINHLAWELTKEPQMFSPAGAS
jgi:hypothetical protein